MSTTSTVRDAADRDEYERLVLASVDRFLEKDVRPFAMKLEHDDTYPEDIVARMKELGLFGCIIPEEYGGLGLRPSTYAKIIEKISAVWMSISGIINSHLIMSHIVVKTGTEEQKKRFLPKFATGEIRGGLALTEPDCGTDLQAIRTFAKKDGDHYVINGTKTWISNGIYGSAFALLVKTDREIQPRHKGMTLFIAEKTAGFTVSKKLEKRHGLRHHRPGTGPPQRRLARRRCCQRRTG
jgi:alkylation response protein AidB-like acyl-CoA dehydrogenase